MMRLPWLEMQLHGDGPLGQTPSEMAREHRWDVRATAPAAGSEHGEATVHCWPIQGRKADANALARELREQGYVGVEVIDGWAD